MKSTSTGHLRPSFFIIGERKCGTSSLYRYLVNHPDVLPGRRKEMQFFTKSAQFVEDNFHEYLTRFPQVLGQDEAVIDWPELNAVGLLYEEALHFPRDPNRSYRTGEASADTFCDGSPERLQHYLPDLQLVVILRDPTLRAFSHHRMFHRFQAEGRDLGFEVGDFARDMARELERCAAGQATSFVGPGLYLPNLKRWHRVWKPERLLVLLTSDLAQRPDWVMAQVLDHLGLDDFDTTEILKAHYNRAPPLEMPREVEATLRAFYAPHNRALSGYLGRELPW